MWAIFDRFTNTQIGEPHDTEADAWRAADNNRLTQQGRMADQTLQILHHGFQIREVKE